MGGFIPSLNKLFHSPEKAGVEKDWNQYLVYALVALLILVFSFPRYYPEIQTGPDGSEQFAFNYLFFHHIQFGTRILFTYGPLGFICSPVCIGNNLVTAMVITCAIRFFFIYSFLILGYTVNKSYRVLHIIMAIGLCNLVFIDMMFIGGTIVALLIYHARKEIAWLIAGCLLTTLALLVKSSFGLMCTTILFSYGIYTVIFNKQFKPVLYILLFTPFFFLFTWFILYHNVSGILNYLWSIYQFSKDNSNAMQVEAVNHWGILFIALLCFYLPLFFTKNELTRILYLITLAALYAAFKYSFAREENWHMIFLFTFVIFICALFLILNSSSKALAVMLPLASIALLYANMVMTNTYNIDYTKRITGIDNFITFVTDYSNTVKTIQKEDSATLHDKILDVKQIALIDNNSVDFYPMELTYVAANTLNWTPRPNLQIGAYTPWLDNNNAAYLASADAPGFYVWELEKPPLNNYSLDNHYLMNDEPISIYEFFDHYKVIDTNKKTVLFKHTDNACLSDEQVISTSSGYMGTWLYTPATDNATVLRARIHFKIIVKGVLCKTLYKDQIYSIDYMLANGSVKTYRFTPANAPSGLWVSPHVTDITRGLHGEKVQAIRIRSSKDGYIDNIFKVEWATFRIK